MEESFKLKYLFGLYLEYLSDVTKNNNWTIEKSNRQE